MQICLFKRHVVTRNSGTVYPFLLGTCLFLPLLCNAHGQEVFQTPGSRLPSAAGAKPRGGQPMEHLPAVNTRARRLVRSVMRESRQRNERRLCSTQPVAHRNRNSSITTPTCPFPNQVIATPFHHVRKVPSCSSRTTPGRYRRPSIGHLDRVKSHRLTC